MRKIKIAVLGGGITGQLVNMQMPDAHVYDWKAQPNGPKPMIRNYGANYLWEPLPGIPCREFTVQTRIDGQLPTTESILRYKIKVGKGSEDADWPRQFTPEMQGFEYAQLPPVTVHYGCRATSIDRLHQIVTLADKGELHYDMLVSTIPLYSLLSLLGMPEPRGKLQFKPIFFKLASRPPDAPFPPDVMHINYISDPAIGPYRYTDRDGERHFESIVPYTAGMASKKVAPGKIYAHAGVPEVLEYLAGFNIQTFGRYGSWAPDELVHETWARIAEWKDNIA